VFELIFVAVLIHLLDESGQHIAREMASQDKIVAVETMVKEISDSMTSAILYNITRREEMKRRNEQSRAKLLRAHSKLLRLCAKDPAELESVSRLRNAADEWMRQQDRAIASSPQARVSSFFNLASLTSANQQRPETAAAVILEKEQQILTVQPKLRQQTLIQLQIFFLFGFIANIAITVFLAAFVMRGITDRMGNVLKNTLKFGARLPLDPPLRGTDEIADLDHALHETANEILEFEKFKQQLVAVVSHELRTPLTSVQGTLTLLEAGAMGQFSERANLEIEKAQKSVDHLIKLINNLLLLERLEAGSQIIKRDEIDIGDIIIDVLDSNEKAIEEGHLSVNCLFDELPLVGDWEKLKQTIEIILETCFRRIPQGELLKITGNVDAVGFVEICFFDNGPPLSPVQAANFFDRNRDTEEDELGILFLALAAAIAQAHGGSLEAIADSQSSCFVLKLPQRGKSDD
jgi:signal transduction histidine kinase